MIQRLTSAFSSDNSYVQIVLDLALPDEFIEAAGSQAGIKWLVLGTGFPRYNPSYLCPVLSLFPAGKRRVLSEHNYPMQPLCWNYTIPLLAGIHSLSF